MGKYFSCLFDVSVNSLSFSEIYGFLVDFSISCTIRSAFSSRFTDSKTTKLSDEKRTNRKLTNLQPPLAIPHRTVKYQMTKYSTDINCYRALLPFLRRMKSRILLSGPRNHHVRNITRIKNRHAFNEVTHIDWRWLEKKSLQEKEAIHNVIKKCFESERITGIASRLQSYKEIVRNHFMMCLWARKRFEKRNDIGIVLPSWKR